MARVAQTGGAHLSDYVLKTDSIIPAMRQALYPTDLNKRRDLCRQASEFERPLKKDRLPGCVRCEQAETAVRDITYLSLEGRTFPLELE